MNKSWRHSKCFFFVFLSAYFSTIFQFCLWTTTKRMKERKNKTSKWNLKSISNLSDFCSKPNEKQKILESQRGERKRMEKWSFFSVGCCANYANVSLWVLVECFTYSTRITKRVKDKEKTQLKLLKTLIQFLIVFFFTFCHILEWIFYLVNYLQLYFFIFFF